MDVTEAKRVFSLQSHGYQHKTISCKTC